MSSPNTKISRVAKMRVRPLWKRKLDYCHNKQPSTSNNTNHSTSTKVNPNNHSSKISSPNDEWPINNDSTNSQTHNSHYFPTYSPNNNDPYFVSQTSHGEPRLNVETTLFNDTYPLPKNPTFDEAKYLEELKQSHELNALLAMHLAQRNLNKPPHNPYSPDLPNALNSDQCSNHSYYCPCCQYLLSKTIDISDQLNWLEYLITRPLLPTSTSNAHPHKSSSAPNSPSINN